MENGERNGERKIDPVHRGGEETRDMKKRSMRNTERGGRCRVIG